jgi:hypothetical protein
MTMNKQTQVMAVRIAAWLIVKTKSNKAQQNMLKLFQIQN